MCVFSQTEHESSKQSHSCRRLTQVHYSLQFEQKRQTDEHVEGMFARPCQKRGVKGFVCLFFKVGAWRQMCALSSFLKGSRKQEGLKPKRQGNNEGGWHTDNCHSLRERWKGHEPKPRLQKRRGLRPGESGEAGRRRRPRAPASETASGDLLGQGVHFL